jgi:hypothetical protein
VLAGTFCIPRPASSLLGPSIPLFPAPGALLLPVQVLVNG